MKFFSLKELEKIKEYAGEVSKSSIRAASAMAQKSFRFRDGSLSSQKQIDGAFQEHAVSSSIHRKTIGRISRITWPATQYCTIQPQPIL